MNFIQGASKGSSTEIPLNTREMLDIIEAYHKIPYVHVARDQFISMVLKSPPQISLKNKNKFDITTNEFEQILIKYYIPWLSSMYDWIKMFGICPWYFKKIEGNHRVPVVPPIGAGYITTYLSKKHEQKFKFYWDEKEKNAANVYFETDGHLPMVLNGQLTSAMSTLLFEYRSAQILRNSLQTSWYQQARQQHVFEYHPPKNIPGDDNLITLESFGETIAAQVVSSQENLHNHKMKIRKSVLESSLKQSEYKNKSIGFGHSESKEDILNRGEASIIEHGIPLPADYVYKSAHAPQVHGDYVNTMQRLDRLASAVMDIPLNFVESSNAKTTATVQGSVRFVNEKIKQWISLFETVTKKAILLSYGATIQENIYPLFVADEITVIIPSTPVIDGDSVRQLWIDGMMSQKTAAKYVFNLLGLSEQDITIATPVLLEEEPQKKKNKTSL